MSNLKFWKDQWDKMTDRSTVTDTSRVVTPIVQQNEDKQNEDGKGCGSEYRDKVKCTRYNTVYGPIHRGTIKMSDF